MHYQEAQTTMRVPVAELESWLADVPEWPRFLVGVSAVEKLGHERYRFSLEDGADRRDAVVCVRRQPSVHRFSWRALDGPCFTGCLSLRPIDRGHTSVRLSIASHPGTLAAGLVEMVLPRMSRAAHDLRKLEDCVLAAHA